MKSVIVHGPAASGKTRHKEALRKYFGLSRSIDDWDGRSDQGADTLYLTNVPADRIDVNGRRIFHIQQAQTLLNKARKAANELVSGSSKNLIRPAAANRAQRTRIYIAGPMTGLPGFNYPAFNAAARALRLQGHHVENPADNPAPPCGSWLGYMRLALAQLVTCDELHTLPGWENSKGACIEVRLAQELGLEIKTAP